MFDFDHYVPVLRWKEAERKALINLNIQEKGSITPLIEIVPANYEKFKEDPRKFINTMITEFCEHKNMNFFLDFHLLDSIKIKINKSLLR